MYSSQYRRTHVSKKVKKNTRKANKKRGARNRGKERCTVLCLFLRCVDRVKELLIVAGVLVRLTTCKRLTDSLPKLSLITLSPPETAG